MIIDEKRDFCLQNIAQMKKNGRIIESDHNTSTVEFNIRIDKRKPVREEMFNFKNKHCQAAFKESTQNCPELLNCFANNLPFEEQSKRWKKVFNSLLYKCFRKVRIVSKRKKDETKTKIFENLKEIAEMKKELKVVEIDEEMRFKIQDRIKQIEEEVEREVSEEYLKEIMETLRELGGEENSISGEGRKKMWKLLKRNYPKIVPAVPVGKKDRKGNIITNHKGLKDLYLQTYINRLRNRPIMPGFEDIKKMKTELFNLRIDLAKRRKSQPWTLTHLEAAIKYLKKDKARDPNNLINERFKDEVAGKDLKISILSLLNKIR